MSYNEVNRVKFVKKETGNWPHALEVFVERCFERSKILPPDKLPIFQKQLQDIINVSAQDNSLWDKDWAQVELPVFCTAVEPTNSLKRSKLARDLPSTLTKGLPVPVAGEFDSKERKRLRLARFQAPPLPSMPRSAQRNPNGALIGYCEDLEKHYLRLTSEPDPAKVRPQMILEKTLEYILNKYKTVPTCTYLAYLNNQFKSMRQDLTVQHIKNDFTIKVYETHARIAIDNDDLGEFNQCQTQLKYLYQWKQSILEQLNPEVGHNAEWDDFLSRKFEFMTYKILYMLMTENNSEIYKLKITFLKENDPSYNAIRTYKCVVALFDLQSYIIHGNYYQFFRIYRFFKSKIYMSRAAHLMTGFLVDKQRVRALETVCKSYRQLGVNYLMELLDFSRNDPNEDETDGSTLRKQNISLFFRFYKLQDCEEKGNFDCVKARGIIQNIVVHEGFRKIDIKGQI